MSLPTEQKALVLASKGGALAVQPSPVPAPGAGEVLVQLAAAALNPIDVAVRLFGVFVEKYPAVLGCDGAGTVVALGAGVEGVHVGDRVALQGSIDMVQKSINGTFAQYTATAAKLLIKLPNGISFEAGATMPCTLPTVALALYNHDPAAESPRLLAPWAPGGRGKYAGAPALVLGGSSSVGQYAIQFARLSGFSPIVATASPAHTAHLASLGATHVLDRTLPAASLQAQALALAGEGSGGGGFALVFDAVSLPETLPVGYALTARGGDLVVVSPPGDLGKGDGGDGGEGGDGEEGGKKKRVHMARGMLGIPTNAAAVAELLAALPALLEAGDVKPNRTEVLAGGLAGVPGGLDRLAAKKVSGTKLVVIPPETA